jgi:two-component system, LytTR family, sensor kinase
MIKIGQISMSKIKNVIRNQVFIYHFIAWALYFSLINLNFYIGSGGKTTIVSTFLHMFIVGSIIFYGNVHIISAYCLPRKKYFLEIIGIILLIFVFAIFRYFLDFKLLPYFGNEFVYYKSFDKLFLYDTGWFAVQYLLLSFGYWFAIRAIEIEKEKRIMSQQMIEYERKLNQLERDFLRSQISPHFINNVLSSLYTKTYKKNPDIAENIMLLSEMMSYTTKVSKYDEEVLLEEELENIERFIELERFRYGGDFHVNYSVNGLPDSENKILPLILLTFIENAFKYGDRSNVENPIIITIDITEESLTFFCKNVKQRIISSRKSNNVGLSNTKRRLELKYKDYYTLLINEVKDEYIVSLTLKLTYL